MNDDLEKELSVGASSDQQVPAIAATVPAHVQVENNLAAKESAIQAAVASTQAASAVLQADAAAAKAVVAPAAPPAPAIVAPEPEEAPEPVELDPMQRLEACEAHIEELVRHLAQSFGGAFMDKKNRMGV